MSFPVSWLEADFHSLKCECKNLSSRGLLHSQYQQFWDKIAVEYKNIQHSILSTVLLIMHFQNRPIFTTIPPEPQQKKPEEWPMNKQILNDTTHGKIL